MMEETPELVQVLQELGPGFIRWHPLGLFLRVPLDELNSIRATEHDVLNQTIQMLERWYAHRSPTWRALCKALREVGHPSLADRISVQYCRVSPQEVQQPTSAAPSGVSEPLKADEGQQPITPDTDDHPRTPIPDGRRGEVTGTHPLTCNQPPHPPRQDQGNEQQQQATASQQPLGLPASLEDKRIRDLDEKEKCDIALEFSFMFVMVVQLLKQLLPVNILKTYLDTFRHPMTNRPYINCQLYAQCSTTEAVLKCLHPHYINVMNTYLLRKIVLKFGNDETKQRLEEYDRNFPQSLPIKRLGNPLTEEEMADCPSVKRVKVVKNGDADHITKRKVEEVREALAQCTRTDLEAIIFAQLSDQSVGFIFLVPEGVVSLFSDLRSDQKRLYSLAAIGILRIETDVIVIDVSYERQLWKHEFTQLSLRERTEMGSTLSLDSGYLSDEGDIPPSASTRDHQLAMEFADNLRVNKTAPERTFYRATITDEAATAISKALMGNKSLRELYLECCNISTTGLTSLASALSTNTSLKTLSLRNCKVCDSVVEALAAALSHKNTLEILNLSNHGPHNRNTITSKGCSALARSLHVRQNRSLKRLYLWNNNITDQGVCELSETLLQNSTLEELNLSHNQISSLGASALATSLKRNSSLKALYLSGNSISDKGVTSLAEALRHNNSLLSLYLRNNSISDKGVTSLVDALRHNNSLLRLYLSGNSISDQGVTSLADALRHNNSLLYLHLTLDSVTDTGAEQLVIAIEANDTLRDLKLDGSGRISAKITQRMRDCAKRKRLGLDLRLL